MALVATTWRCHGGHMWMDAKGSDVLSPPECKRLLAVAAKDGLTGRLGVPTDRAPVITPVNFTFVDHQIVLRVGAGFIAGAAGGRLIAFEVDHVDSDGGVAWSVLVRGLATLVEVPEVAQLASAPRPSVPEPGAMVLTIRPDVVTGRRFAIRPRAARAMPPEL